MSSGVILVINRTSWSTDAISTTRPLGTASGDYYRDLVDSQRRTAQEQPEGG